MILGKQDMILDRYKIQRTLGKGNYGQVVLVQDINKNKYAVKMIKMKHLLKQPHLLQYFQSEIQCMKDIDSPYMMKLYFTTQDQNYRYLFCQYCDGGNLFQLQSKQEGRVFTLQKTCEIMSEIIKGLYDLHKKGYLHRDIKNQNILVKIQNGKQIFKLADFGFSKKPQRICSTICGTQTYQSPQTFSRQSYGYEIDMWAFGVLFYFMLNLEYPFISIIEINSHESPKKKQIKLEEAGRIFSYKKNVKESRKKLMQNCTQEVEQLFKRIFDPQANRRITFAEIRQTKLFKKYFPANQGYGVSFYQKRFINKFEKKQIKKEKEKENKEEQNIRESKRSIFRINDQNYPEQKRFLSDKKDSIDFLRDNALQFLQSQNILKPQQKYPLSFNLIKYYIILLREFIQNLNPNPLLKAYPNIKWQQFSMTNAFKLIKSEAEKDKIMAQLKFYQLYNQCLDLVQKIEKLNPNFKAAFKNEINEKQFENAFKDSYRKSTFLSFFTIRELIKKSLNKGNILSYHQAILVISHAFNRIFLDKKAAQIIFSEYFSNTKKTVQTIEYEQLRQWMTKANAYQLDNISKQIIKHHFT